MRRTKRDNLILVANRHSCGETVLSFPWNNEQEVRHVHESGSALLR